MVLQGCPCPPSRLRHGFYWYDKVYGFWWKEGHKPHCIISTNLNVGGSLDQKASNENTGILINGREITKSVLQMLKLSGVQCVGKPLFWVNADGTYQEEGQKTVKGKIWDKPIVKLLSPVVSLPTPNKAANQCGEEAVHMVNRPIPDYLEQRTCQKLLLVGSGASTIVKQAKFLYKNKPFTADAREDLKLVIQSNIYNYLGILLEGHERFEDEALADRRRNSQHDPSCSGHCQSGSYDEVSEYSLIPRLKAFSDWILEAPNSWVDVHKWKSERKPGISEDPDGFSSGWLILQYMTSWKSDKKVDICTDSLAMRRNFFIDLVAHEAL